MLSSHKHYQQLSLVSNMSGCHAVFLLIIPSSCLCPGNELKIECPIWKLPCGQWQETAQVDMNKTEMKWIFKINKMSKLPEGLCEELVCIPRVFCVTTPDEATLTGVVTFQYYLVVVLFYNAKRSLSSNKEIDKCN